MKIVSNQSLDKKISDLYDKYSIDTEEERHKAENFMNAITDLIELCGDDSSRQGFDDTPYRVLKAHLEYTAGYREDPKEHLRKFFDVDHDELIVVKDIEFNSLCEHHFAPFFGVAHVGYIPNGKITGLSKIGRMIDGYAERFQVQERLTNQIADAMQEILDPKGVMVVIEGKHMCMCGRGVKKRDSSTTTSASRDIFKKDIAQRQEFLSLIEK